jgi:hypothetical protein
LLFRIQHTESAPLASSFAELCPQQWPCRTLPMRPAALQQRSVRMGCPEAVSISWPPFAHRGRGQPRPSGRQDVETASGGEGGPLGELRLAEWGGPSRPEAVSISFPPFAWQGGRRQPPGSQEVETASGHERCPRPASQTR